MITTDNIDKLGYIDILKRVLPDKEVIVSSLIQMKNENIREKTIKSSWCNNYKLVYLTDGFLVYSIIGDYIIIYPMEFIINNSGNENIIFVKRHVIQRYEERFLFQRSNRSISRFMISFCKSDSKIITREEKRGIFSISIRIKDGALLGYCYNVDPKIIRINTFISDKEIEVANRSDQILLTQIKEMV